MTGSPVSLDYTVFKQVVKKAVRDGSAGETLLLNILDRVTVEDQPVVVAALGESTGGASMARIRALVQDKSADSDVRTSAIIALVKRHIVNISDVLSPCLRDEDRAIRQYAVLGVAVSGDGRDHDYVLGMLQRYLSTAKPFSGDGRFLSLQSKVIPMAIYLARHSNMSVRRQVADLIQRNRDRLGSAEIEWFTVFWPDCVGLASSGIEPEPSRMVEWQRSPLFDPQYRT